MYIEGTPSDVPSVVSHATTEFVISSAMSIFNKCHKHIHHKATSANLAS